MNCKIAVVLGGLTLLALYALCWAQGPATQSEDPAMIAWAKVYGQNVLGWNAAYFDALDKSTASPAQKWALGKSMIDLEAKHGPRGLRALWEEAQGPAKAAMRAATKSLLAQAKAQIDAQKAEVDKAIIDADAAPMPSSAPARTPER